jgi:hypothetical protein
MMSANIFSRTMIEAIRKYRETLRKHVRQGERMQKLKQLGLKDENLNESATSLYHTGYRIINDINQNFDSNQTGYYSYNGVKKFSEYLQAYLDQFEVIKDKVVHKSQLASQSLVKSIQLLSMPSKDNLTIKIVTELSKCIRTIAAYGTEQQKELLERTLTKVIAIQEKANPSGENIPADLAFYQSVLEDFQQHMGETVE